VFILNSSPLKPFDERIDLLYKGFGEKSCRHIVNRDGGKHKGDILLSTSMVQFISLKRPKFSHELSIDEVMSFVAIFV
jgi:hypothetical protein